MKNKIKFEASLVFSLFIFSMLIVSSIFVLAQNATTSATTTTTASSTKEGISVNPAKLGIYRVTIPLFSDYVATKSFVVGNAYNVPVNISLQWNGNISQIAELSEMKFVLQPNESKEISYTLTVKEPGVYGGGAGIVALVGGKSFIGYQADLYVFAQKSQVPQTAFYVAGGVVVLIVAFLAFKKFGGKKISSKKLRYLANLTLVSAIFAVSIASFAAFASSVNAKDIAMIVKDASSLDSTHEQRIYNILTAMGHDVTLVDKNVGVNYNNYNLIVVAGRPLGEGTLDSFVATLPVNDIPTVAIDFGNIDNWGWIKNAGASSLSTSDRQKVYPQIAHPLSYGYSIGQKVYVHLITGYNVVDLVKGMTKLTTVASADTSGNIPVIAYANPNTQLANGNKVGNHGAIVFFGITYPNLWTEDAVNLFKDSVNWLLNIDFTPPTVPQLAIPDSGFDKDGIVKWQWTASNHSAGISYYEFQLSNSPTFSTLVTNTTTTALNYTTNGLTDTQTYYARVRAWNNLNIYSNWSTAQVTIDSSNLIVKINSPSSGETISSGSSIIINATVATPNRMSASNGTCNVTIANTFAGTIPFNKTINTCSGTVTAPSLSFSGSSFLLVTARNSLGNTNSTNVTIQYQGPAPVSSSGDSSGGSSGGGGDILAALLFVQVPTQFTTHENSDMTFTVTVKNEGLIAAEAVKVNVEKLDIASPEVTPQLVTLLGAGVSQDFTVKLHFPEGSQGNYQFRIKTLGYGISITKRLSVDVLPEVKEPSLRTVGVEMPASFIAGQETTVNYTLVNEGNEVGNAEVNVNLPEGWMIRNEDQNQAIVIDSASQDELLFHITPSDQSGKIEFVVNYSVEDQDKTFMESYDVNATNATSGGSNVNGLSITGLVVAFVDRPEFYIPTLLIGLGTFVAIYLGLNGRIEGLKRVKLSRISRETLRYIWPRRVKTSIENIVPKTTQKNNFTAKKPIPSSESQRVLNNAYNKWETRSRRV